jgi:hypothetical protein
VSPALAERARRAALPAVLLFVFAISAGAIGYATSAGNDDAAPVEPPMQPVSQAVRGIVISLAGEDLRLRTDAGEIDLKLAPDAAIEALRPVTIAGVQPGDWVNVGAVRHASTLFAISAIVVIPAASLEGPR